MISYYYTSVGYSVFANISCVKRAEQLTSFNNNIGLYIYFSFSSCSWLHSHLVIMALIVVPYKYLRIRLRLVNLFAARCNKERCSIGNNYEGLTSLRYIIIYLDVVDITLIMG